MATFDAADFVNRIRRNIPRRWQGTSAWNDGTNGAPTGILYALMLAPAQLFSYMLLTVWPYGKQQCRLATITDEYVDLASKDFFRERLPRAVGESDPEFSTRIRQTLVAPTGVQNAITRAIAAYFTLYPDPLINSIDVFDRQTDPARAAQYGIQDAQFAVVLNYKTEPDYSWYLGQAYLGQNTWLVNHLGYSVSPNAPYPLLAQYINDAKDLCYRPIYVLTFGNQQPPVNPNTEWTPPLLLGLTNAPRL